MIISRKDPGTGAIDLIVEDLDDLWHLSQVVNPGDRARMLTQRREDTAADQIRSKRGEKRSMVLTLAVESVEFHDTTSVLRILGVIVEGPQDIGSHHTFNVMEGDRITVIKRWKRYELHRIEEAASGRGKQKVVFLSVEDDNIVLADLFGYGVRERATFSVQGGKFEGKGPDRISLYDEAVNAVAQSSPQGIVVVGPGFFKEEFLKRARERDKGLFGRAHLVNTGQGGMSGVREALSKGLAKDVLKDARLSRDSELVDRLMTEIAKDGKVAYGLDECRDAVEAGAVETLIATEERIRQPDMLPVLEAAEKMQAAIHIVSSRSEPGKQLASLGGVGALLRYALR